MDADPHFPALCPKCFTHFQTATPDTCPHCRRGTLVKHQELFELSLAHLDCDAFYAAVEKRDNPALRDKPLIVGGGTRGVVTTACYIARMSGVRSAMPMFKARRLCPQATIVKPRMSHYRSVSQDIRTLMLKATPQIEPISIDEAFLDLGGTQRLHKAPPAVTMMKLARQIERDIGITVSVGLSYNKYLAKVASDYRKPRGFHVIGRSDAKTFLASQSVSLLWGVGKAFARKLKRDGVTHIGQLQAMSHSTLVTRYGSMGSHIWRLANGKDSRRVSTHRTAKSISSERTFSADINALDMLSDVLWSLCEEVSASLRAKSLHAKTVHLKLKTSDFQSLTRSHTPKDALVSARSLFTPARKMLEACAHGQDFRLLGVGVSGLSQSAMQDAQAKLFEEAAPNKGEAVEDVMSEIRARFGKSSIETGRGNRARTSGLNRRQSVSKNGSGSQTP